MHTVGLFLEQGDPAREQLQCIAAATGATYRDVDEIDALSGELGRIVVQSIPEIGNIHLPIQGAWRSLDAPLLELVAQPEDESGNNRFGAFMRSSRPTRPSGTQSSSTAHRNSGSSAASRPSFPVLLPVTPWTW